MKTPSTHLILSLLCFLLASVISHAQTEEAILVAQEEDSSTFESKLITMDNEGRPVVTTNRFTIQENALNYFENGKWHPSQDLIETFPEGAVARQGPHRAVFAPVCHPMLRYQKHSLS